MEKCALIYNLSLHFYNVNCLWAEKDIFVL